ncbi:radical SAM family heme chaperone HemW [Opitutus terrae]|uniref:Heme chaperone HemW n=1 Tax=Opitutus terrae (strain DSM 11246 / JCM 15787 / PB90-1) TaxID=452637 RepID=B1ZW52_OPITP|nr:radical SAM family heme chaperone HemW [Opitutus terrae]ACB76066.1 oxygen-independent coproporphyrinogen III oxidase [Opitutus terrae PB90-1]
MSHLASEQAKAERAAALGLYVHVPFCASTCDFCAFYQTKPTAQAVKSFVEGVARELGLVTWSRPVNTVFWGGGTPGLLAARDLRRLGLLVRERCGGTPVEWSVEMAPGSVTVERLAALREVGVTRISMGVQSFQPALLDALGRQHSREQIYRAYDRVRAAGFASVNIDMMFALPGQTEAEWQNDLRAALALEPDHISTYCLTFEEDTALWVKLSQGRVKLDLEHEARLYESTWAQLAAAGFAQYEVSNFARPGHACLHNLNTWRMQEWAGVGPSAASQQDGWRGANIADLTRWRENVDQSLRVTEDRTALTPASLAEDALIFGLRMNEGVNLEVWRTRSPDAPWNVVMALVDRLVADGLAQCEGPQLRLTNRGRLLADAVGADVMEAFSAEPAHA